MKILAIRGKNLASLAGEFEIDFTAEPLKSAGIFAITGSTGSGKSTLLDALCLALFDSTPRMTKAKESKVELADVRDRTIAQSDSRSVLRRGTADGYAEVDFIALTGETYRSTWTASRAGGKPTGSLRAVTMRLVNLSEEREEQGTKRELLARISALIGLSFEQFNRSVLLAQGDFALFLKARQAEKAEILEKLTGTEIYSRISASIYAKTKGVEMEYKLLQERMKGIELLPEEQVEAMEAEKIQSAQALAALQKEEETLAACLKWLEEERALTRNKEKAEKEWQDIRTEMEAAAPRYALLARIDRAQDIRDTFMRAQATQKQLSDSEQAGKERQEQMQKTVVLSAQASQALEAAQKEQTAWKEHLSELEPQLNKAKELDVQITEKQKQCREAQNEYQSSLRQKEQQEKGILAAGKEVKQLLEQQATLAEWFAHYSAYATLIPAIELVTTLLANWETAKEQSALNQKTLDDVRNLCTTEQQRLTAMQQEAERLNRLLPAEIIVLRSQLQQGEPCPVCGSTHHPAATLTEVQSLQEAELKQSKEKVAKEIERLTAAVNSRNLEIARLTAVVGNYSTQAADAVSKVSSYVSILPSWEELLRQGRLKDAVKRFGTQWNDRLKEQVEVKDLLTRKQAQLDALRRESETNVLQVEEKQKKAEALEKELATCRSQRALLLEGRPTSEVVDRNHARHKELELRVEKAMKQHHDLLGTLESYKGQNLQLEQDTARLKSSLATEQQEIAAWLSRQDDNLTYAALEALLSKDTAWAASEKKALNVLQERSTSAQAVCTERQQQLAAHAQAPHKPAAEENEQTLGDKLAACKQEKERETNRLAQINMLLGNQEKNRQKRAAFDKEMEERQSVYENWAKLNELFGSQNGVKFKEIAQGYTLDVLLLYANKHLQDLAPRYELQRISDTLALQIVDLDMMGEVRSVHSLSGGESFLVSLALALGLSSLSSNRMNVESLFIDEGFGSLDIETLRIAMDALERLQMQGRKIGVISHVAEMTERISAQIRIVKDGKGKSGVRVE